MSRKLKSINKTSFISVVFAFIWPTILAIIFVALGYFVCIEFKLTTLAKVLFLVVACGFEWYFYMNAIDDYKLWKENRKVRFLNNEKKSI